MRYGMKQDNNEKTVDPSLFLQMRAEVQKIFPVGLNVIWLFKL